MFPWQTASERKIEQFEYNGYKITNFEMESSALAGLSRLMGHKAMTVCMVIANRLIKEANTGYKIQLTILFLKYSNVFKYLIGYKIRRKHYLCVIKQAVNNEPRYYLRHSYRPGRGYWMYSRFRTGSYRNHILYFTPAATNRELGDSKPYTLTFGRIYDGSEVIDEVLVSLFRAPHSYTGENSTEITCHGSAYILQKVLQLLIKNGCRMAAPGEYTQRAFLNGKMDLSQAEAVADLIASSSAATHRLAMSQMRGGFSKELATLRDQLLHFTSLIELELDFSDHEELEFADRSELCQLANNIEKVIARLVNSFNVGNAIKTAFL